MVQPNRKNIYIPDDQAEVYEKAEIFAKSQDVSLSVLIGKALDYYITVNDKNEKEIYLTIKSYKDNSKIPIIKQIKFIGEEIAESNFIDDTKSIQETSNGFMAASGVVFDENDFYEDDYVSHNYTVYKTQKGKLLVYIYRKHERNYTDGFGNYCSILKEDQSYKIYEDISDMVKDLRDMQIKTIEKVVEFNTEVEILDI